MRYDKYDAPVPLYNIVQLTYISTTNVAIIAGVITGSACLVCLLADGLRYHVANQCQARDGQLAPL